jgi:para-aminobenzoate synthetase/4-amino-4-deoxychorismate lyase
MVSRITARLRSEMRRGRCAANDLPLRLSHRRAEGGGHSGAVGREPEPRGAHGSMGWIEPGGDAAFNVLIRTLEWHRGTTKARLGLGSGLVVDSVPRNEWDECILKGDFVRREAQGFDLIETMGFDPSEGIVELERHLDRMGNSARDLDFKFDRHAARNELQAATFRRKQRAMVRLLLSRTGAMRNPGQAHDDPEELPVRVAVRPLPSTPAISDCATRPPTAAFDLTRQQAGEYETIFVDPDGQLTEGSRTSLFVEHEGKLLTPPLSRGLMPGILRAKLIEEGKAEEAELTPADLQAGFYIGNVVRGLIPAKLA